VFEPKGIIKLNNNRYLHTDHNTNQCHITSVAITAVVQADGAGIATPRDLLSHA